jgi:hypothetical protein
MPDYITYPEPVSMDGGGQHSPSPPEPTPTPSPTPTEPDKPLEGG